MGTSLGACELEHMLFAEVELLLEDYTVVLLLNP